MNHIMATNDAKANRPIWLRVVFFFTFLICVNLLAGYLAIEFRYPSLYNVKASFAEYAVPLPFYWGFAHIPSMLIFGIPLLLFSELQEKHKRYLRTFFVFSFLLLLLELDKKIPFLLFPKIDAVTALIFSLVLSPPNRKENPVLIRALNISAVLGILFLGLFTYSTWIHRTPEVTIAQYGNGLFELKSIVVNNDFRKSMSFEVDLKMHLPADQACNISQSLAKGLLRDYPFDNEYEKTISVVFNPASPTSHVEPYSLGEISLNDEHMEKDGRFACYLKFKRSPGR